MPYVRRTWQNAPSSATPLNAAALNNIENGVEEALDAIAELPATYGAVFADTAIAYDGSGNVSSVTENGITTTYTYNADGTVDTDTRLGVTREYTYDGSGNLTGIEAV